MGPPTWANIARMLTLRRLRPFLVSLIYIVAIPATAFAQGSPPVVDKGVCAPWHRCLAFGTMGLAVVAILGLGLGFMLQRRGFDKIEHRQGSPDGVEVEKH